MPVSSSSPSVNVPWQSQSGTPIDPAISADFRKVDGWDLVYNSFSPDGFPVRTPDEQAAGLLPRKGVVATTLWQPTGGLYFALYNRYRGLLRYYLYVPPGFFGSSTQLSHGLSLFSASSTSKMLNFEGVDVVDVTTSSHGFSTTSKDGISTTGGWYVMQYELAYDPAFAGTTYPNPAFKWNTYSLSVTQIKLDGVEVGTTKGTITTPQPEFDWAKAAGKGVLGVAEVSAGLFSPSTTGFKFLQKVATAGLSGSTKGFFSGIFGGSAPTPQQVALSMNSTITTTGTASTSQLYQANSFVFPGQNTGTGGVAPLINYPLGLFNLSARPTIYYEKVVREAPIYFNDQNVISYYYTTDVTEVQNLLRLNPAIFNSNPTVGATISNFEVEVVILDPPSGPEWSVGGVQEILGTRIANTQYPTVPLEFQGTGLNDPGRLSVDAAVRVSFNVKSNDPNGPQNILVVKTFLANVVSQ